MLASDSLRPLRYCATEVHAGFVQVGSKSRKEQQQEVATMQLSAGQSVQVRAFASETSRPVIACPLQVLAAKRAPIAYRQLSAHSSSSCKQQQSLRSSVLVRSTPLDAAPALKAPGQHLQQSNVVYKFGGSSVRDAERMREVADIICSFPQYLPCVVLSAMGKTTNNLLECGELALSSSVDGIPNLQPYKAVRDLHLATCDELGVEPAVKAEVVALLDNLQQLLIGICIMQDLTARARDSLVSFGERMSTRIFTSYLRQRGVPARQFDAPEIGFITSDDFGNADIIYEQTLPKVRKALTLPSGKPMVQIITGFLGKGVHTGAITTLGRGGSDLTATLIGAALDMAEVQVWKDVDGVLSSDPRIVSAAQPVNELTYEEATELAFFGAQVLHPLAMQPAVRSQKMDVRVKNSYNRTAEGTRISKERDMSCSLVTSIVLKNSVTLVDIVSSRMLGQFGFLATVFDVFRTNQVSVDVVATSEVSISLSLDPKKCWHDGEIGEELNKLIYELERVAAVKVKPNMAILSLICNVERTSEILLRTFKVFIAEGINVSMMSQGASKVNISLIIESKDAQRAVKALHKEFFEGTPVCAPKTPQLAGAAANGNGNGKA